MTKNGGLFVKVIRVIFENMRQRIFTLVSMYIIFRAILFR